MSSFHPPTISLHSLSYIHYYYSLSHDPPTVPPALYTLTPPEFILPFRTMECCPPPPPCAPKIFGGYVCVPSSESVRLPMLCKPGCADSGSKEAPCIAQDHCQLKQGCCQHIPTHAVQFSVLGKVGRSSFTCGSTGPENSLK